MTNRRWTIFAAICGLVTLLVLGLLLTGTFKFYNISGGSMSPTLEAGDSVFVTRMSPAGIERGKLVVFDASAAHKPLSGEFTQRVVAVEGDTIEVIGDVLHVNGIPLPGRAGKIPRPAQHQIPSMPSLPEHPLTVPQGRIFTLGDNHDNSLDSRYFGAFPATAVTHSPRSIIRPWGRMGRLE